MYLRCKMKYCGFRVLGQALVGKNSQVFIQDQKLIVLFPKNSSQISSKNQCTTLKKRKLFFFCSPLKVGLNLVRISLVCLVCNRLFISNVFVAF